jgi:hypothetical protein
VTQCIIPNDCSTFGTLPPGRHRVQSHPALHYLSTAGAAGFTHVAPPTLTTSVESNQRAEHAHVETIRGFYFDFILTGFHAVPKLGFPHVAPPTLTTSVESNQRARHAHVETIRGFYYHFILTGFHAVPKLGFSPGV